jgi:hypothetical protein
LAKLIDNRDKGLTHAQILYETDNGDRNIILCRNIFNYSYIYRLLVGKPEGKKPLGRPKRRWIDNIKIDVLGIGLGVWTGLVWLRIGTGGELL